MATKIAEKIEEIRQAMIPVRERSKAAKTRLREKALFSGTFGCLVIIPEGSND